MKKSNSSKQLNFSGCSFSNRRISQRRVFLLSFLALFCLSALIVLSLNQQTEQEPIKKECKYYQEPILDAHSIKEVLEQAESSPYFRGWKLSDYRECHLVNG